MDKPDKRKRLHAPGSLASTINFVYMLSFTVCLVLASIAILIVLRVFIVSWGNDDIKALQKSLDNKTLFEEEKVRGLVKIHSVSVLFCSFDGKKIYEINSLPSGESIPLSEKKYLSRYLNKHSNEHEYRLYFETREIKGERYYIQIVRDVSYENRVYSILSSIIIFSVILTVTTGIVIGFPVSSYLLKPITKMTSTISEISEKSLAVRIDTKKSKSELKDLGESINKALDKLENAYNTQSNFISDVSHELKTPLSVIAGYADLLSRWGKDDPDVLSEAVSAISVQTKAINDMLSKFTFLSRAENNELLPVFNHFNLYELINDIISDFSLLHPNLSYENNCEKTAIIYADKALIRQLLVILIDNSSKYTPSEGKITVTVEPENKQIAITVSDTGIGIPKEDLDKIFTRFYRVDKSRTKSTGGFGLGLAIAFQIVSSHKGQIYAENTDKEGARIKILLPQPF